MDIEGKCHSPDRETIGKGTFLMLILSIKHAIISRSLGRALL